MEQANQQSVDSEYFFKELDLIQGIITRMAGNSFQIKGWALTLIVGSMVLSQNPQHRLFAFIPLVAFWYLDAYYLQLEKCYRKLYEWTINNRPICRDNQFDLNAHDRFKKDVESISQIMRSKTLLWFYGVILILIVAFNWENIAEIFYLYVPKPIYSMQAS
jgi:hypothetical protein